ncbi:MAG: hypothetical protein MJ171_08190 [Clostridia bacterium]|nr:hypothetical protein [Clostridia bacterium]
MKRVLVKSVFDAFEYVMDHYTPAGLEDMGEAKDTYAVISIQDTHTDGFGVEFTTSKYCEGVLTLHFDDIVKEVEGAVLFNTDMANEIIDFVEMNMDCDTLLVHCYAGQSRSMAVGLFVLHMLGRDNQEKLSRISPNMYVYNKLIETYENRNK